MCKELNKRLRQLLVDILDGKVLDVESRKSKAEEVLREVDEEADNETTMLLNMITDSNTPYCDVLKRRHILKVLPEFYKEGKSNRKTFEVRLHDRDYKVGDLLILREWSADKGYTGKRYLREITYILDDDKFCKEGYVVLALKPKVLNNVQTMYATIIVESYDEQGTSVS